MDGRWGDAKHDSGLLDRQWFALWRTGRRLEAGNTPVAAQVADAAGGEAITICRGPLLPIEDAGDHTKWAASRRSSAIVSSSVRTVAGRERGSVRSTSLSAPPFQRSPRWGAAFSRSTLETIPE